MKTLEEFNAYLVDSASEWQAFERDTQDLKERIDAHDIVFGVVLVDAAAGIVNAHLIKGAAALRKVATADSNTAAKIAGVYCRSIEEAEAMRQALGDGKSGGGDLQ